MRVKLILKEKGITAKKLSEMIGMTEAGVSLALSENGNPKLETLKEISTALDVPISELFAPKNSTDFQALVEYRGELKKFVSIEELKNYIDGISGGI